MNELGWIIFIVFSVSFILAVLLGSYWNMKNDLKEISEKFESGEDPGGGI